MALWDGQHRRISVHGSAGRNIDNPVHFHGLHHLQKAQAAYEVTFHVNDRIRVRSARNGCANQVIHKIDAAQPRLDATATRDVARAYFHNPVQRWHRKPDDDRLRVPMRPPEGGH